MAIYLAHIKTIDELCPPRGESTYPAGIMDYDKGYIKYAPKSSTQPTLAIVNPIGDNDGNIILPGYYELVLSYDRTMLILSQSEKIIAQIPVFKVEEDLTQEELAQPNSNKAQRKFDKEKKKEEKKNKKLLRERKISSLEPEVYNKATIEYRPDGNYYLLMYERGKLRAWGAIKSGN